MLVGLKSIEVSRIITKFLDHVPLPSQATAFLSLRQIFHILEVLPHSPPTGEFLCGLSIQPSLQELLKTKPQN